MEQIPSQNKGRAERFLRHKALRYVPDGHGLESVKTGHEASFSRHFHEPGSMRDLEEIREGAVVIERESAVLLSQAMGEQQ